MILDLTFLLREANFSIRNPRAGAARVLSWAIPNSALWPLVALTIILSTLGAELSSALNPPSPGQPVIYIPPVGMAGLLAAVNISMAAALAVIGRFMGGRGSFRSALILMSWQQFLWLCLLLAVMIAGLVLPALAGILTILGFGFMIWVLVNFTAELHGFSGIGAAILCLILASVMASMVLMVVLGMVGITITGGAPG